MRQCRVAELDRRSRTPRLRDGELEENIRALETGRSFPEELLQHCHGLLDVARVAMQARCPEAPSSRQGGIVDRQLGRELRELGCRSGCPSRRRLVRGSLEMGGRSPIRAGRGERHVACPLLDVRDRAGERSVHCTALPERRAAVADRAEQRMCESHGGLVEFHDGVVRRRPQRFENTVPLAVRRRHELDRRSCERGDQQQDVERLAGEACQPASEQLAQALGHAQRLARRRSRVRSDELPAELQCKERVARGRLLHAGELGPRQLEPQPFLEQAVHGGERERADRQSLEPLVRERALELDRARHLRSQPQRGQQPDRLLSKTPKRDLERTRRRRVEPLDVIEGDQDGPCSANARSTSSTASPIACGSGAVSPGSASSSATSSACLRGGASDGPTSSSTSPRSSESPAKDSEASASTPLHVRMEPNRPRAFSSPPPRARSSRSPPHRREQRARAQSRHQPGTPR